MGNIFGRNEQNENNNNNNNINNENLLINQDNQIENQNNQNIEDEDENEEVIVEEGIDTLYIKEVGYDQQLDHLMNPVLLLKESLTLEQDAISNKKYYIKFNYDALLNFNCYISFKVKRNKDKKNFPKLINVSPEKYELAYIPNPQNKNTIIFKNLKKGENIEFLEKNAIIDIDEFNKDIRGDNEKEFDVSFEFVPILEKDSDDFKNKNEIIFINLCNLFLHNGHYEIRTIKQEFKSFGLWFNLYDVFDSSNNGTCLICYNKKCNTIVIPCNHSFACVLCANHIKENERKCPICKKDVEDIIIVNIS